MDAQNALARSLLDGPDREAIKRRLSELYDYPRVSVPSHLVGTPARTNLAENPQRLPAGHEPHTLADRPWGVARVR